MDVVYEIDKQIIEQFAQALLNRDQEELQEAMINANARLSGFCCCLAQGKEDCVCGAWGKDT